MVHRRAIVVGMCMKAGMDVRSMLYMTDWQFLKMNNDRLDNRNGIPLSTTGK